VIAGAMVPHVRLGGGAATAKGGGARDAREERIKDSRAIVGFNRRPEWTARTAQKEMEDQQECDIGRDCFGAPSPCISRQTARLMIAHRMTKGGDARVTPKSCPPIGFLRSRDMCSYTSWTFFFGISVVLAPQKVELPSFVS
jgi:hypothetical protein